VGLTQAVVRHAGAERRRRRRGGSRCRWAPVSGGVESGSCSTGEDGDSETRPNSRGLGGWPSSPRMADDSGSGGVRRGPELLGRRRSTEGIEGGGGGGENASHGRGREGRGKKRDGRRPAPFMAARWRGRGKGQGGPELKGGIYMVHHQ
jgi:hypothetical protein